MKVTGFSFIRNAIKFDYPIIESIHSILPICDDFVIAVGNSEDGTLDLIKNINSPKIKIIETIWDDSLREGGKVLAIETDKAFQAIPADSDWAFYLQGDEVIHEKYLDTIYNTMLQWKDNPEVDGLLFNYKHFFGSYDYIHASTKWYGHEIRVVRNKKKIYSYRDAQGFRKNNNEKLNVKPVDACVYHYGYVKHPQLMQSKYENAHRLYFDDIWMKNNIPNRQEFDYSEIGALARFEEKHPRVMEERIRLKNWKFNYDLSMNRFTPKDKFKTFVKKYFGIYIGYKNYKILQR